MGRDVKRILARAAGELVSQHTVEETLDQVLAMCVEMIDGCDLAGISLVRDGRVRTLAATGEVLRAIDDMQFRLQEGPCYDAIRLQEVVTADDLATDTRWPTWGPIVSDKTGVHSSMSFRLFSTHQALGALNLYSKVPAAFGPEDALEGQVVASQAAVTLAAILQEEQLKRAVETRTVIGQATGILMERFELDADSAFAVMRRLSQDLNIKLYALARGLVETGHLPGLDPGGQPPRTEA